MLSDTLQGAYSGLLDWFARANGEAGHRRARVIVVFGRKSIRSTEFQGATAGEALFTIWLMPPTPPLRMEG